MREAIIKFLPDLQPIIDRVVQQVQEDVLLYILEKEDNVSGLETADMVFISTTGKVITKNQVDAIRRRLQRYGFSKYILARDLTRKNIYVLELDQSRHKQFIDVMDDVVGISFKQKEQKSADGVTVIDPHKWYTIGFPPNNIPSETRYAMEVRNISSDWYETEQECEFYARINNSDILNAALRDGCSIKVSSLTAETLPEIVVPEFDISRLRLIARRLMQFCHQYKIAITSCDIVGNSLHIGTSTRLHNLAIAQLRGHLRLLKKLNYFEGFDVLAPAIEPTYATYGFKSRIMNASNPDDVIKQSNLTKVADTESWSRDKIYLTVRGFNGSRPTTTTYVVDTVEDAVQFAVEMHAVGGEVEVGYWSGTKLFREIFDNSMDKSIHRVIMSGVIPSKLKFYPFNQEG